MSIKYRALLACYVMAALSSTSLWAGSVAPDPLLASVASVRLTVAGGDYQPVPGLDVQGLRTKMGERTASVLNQAGIEVADSSGQLLTVTMQHAWSEAAGESVAILLSVDLWIPAEAVPCRSGTEDRYPREFAVFSDERLDLAARSATATVTLDMLDAILERLVETRLAALAAQSPAVRSGDARADCH